MPSIRFHESVFWPSDCREPGQAFGWSNTAGSATVAGVIEEDFDTDTLSQILEGINIADLGKLELLGRCDFEKGIRVPSFSEYRDTSIVLYHRHQPNTLRFYSMDAFGLEIDDSSRASEFKSSGGISREVVAQLNVASSVDAAVRLLLKRTKSSSRATVSQITDFLVNALSTSLILLSRPIETICKTPVFSKALLKDVSLSVQQMDVRTEQLTVLARRMTALRTPKNKIIEVYSIEYSSFFNTVWLILNDITIGYAFGTFLCENHQVLAKMMKELSEDVLISWLQWVLRWLDSWPAGLKLNTELSRFYSGTFVDLVDVWGSVLQHIIFPHLNTIIYSFGAISSLGALVGGMGGLTMSIALFYDIFVVFTVHIYVCYAITRVVYAKVLWAMGSLWRLFRGKRFNVLRNRTDSWEYDLDQLLFGTILFTLLAFLFPTVLAYYALFALLRLSTILIQASLEVLLAFMNHFPLFALVLRFKDPWRLPGGLYFDFVPARVKVKIQSYAGSGSRDGYLRKMGDNDVPSASVDSATPTPDLGNPSDLKVERSEPLASQLVPILEFFDFKVLNSLGLGRSDTVTDTNAYVVIRTNR